VPADVSIVAAVRGVSVLLRVPCVQTLVPTPLPFYLLLLVFCVAVLTGTACLLFHTLLHVDRTQSKFLFNPFRVLRNPCHVKQLDTRLRIAQRRAHQLGKRPPPPLIL
jgi:hypothetical protein